MPIGTVRSYVAKKQDVRPQWFHLDVTDRVLGRIAAEIARVLMGKHKVTYTPHVDEGDFVVVTNVQKVRLTGAKRDTKQYSSYTYHSAGRKVVPFKTMFQSHPERVLTEAVRRMLPKNKLGRKMLGKLKVYRGDSHPHAAQRPMVWPFDKKG